MTDKNGKVWTVTYVNGKKTLKVPSFASGKTEPEPNESQPRESMTSAMTV